MPSYKLTYFNFRGRGEIIRMVFKAANVDFEDNRLEYADWPKVKAKTYRGANLPLSGGLLSLFLNKGTPLGKVPVLEIDGKPYPQSHSLARYLARKHGLGGKNEMEQLQADVIADTCEDILQEMVKFHFEKDEAKKAELMQNFKDVVLPAFLKTMSQMAEDYGGKSGFLVGSDLTWADLRFYDLMETLVGQFPDSLEKFPTLSSNRQRVKEHPKIKQYLKDRPVDKV